MQDCALLFSVFGILVVPTIFLGAVWVIRSTVSLPSAEARRTVRAHAFEESIPLAPQAR